MSARHDGPRVRHGFLAVALLVVAGLRLADGDLWWASLLGAAGLVEAWLAMPAGRGAGPAPAASGPPWTPATRPDASVVQRSLVGHRRHLRLWSGCLVLCTVGAASVLDSAPALSVVLAALALAGLQRVRRARRSLAVLTRLAAQDAPTGGSTA